MLRNRIPSMLSVVIATLLLTVGLLPVHAASALVQQNNVGCSNCSSTLSVSFTNNVASGDVIVVGVVIADASFTLGSLTDSLRSSFTQAVASNNVPPPIVYIFYANLSSSGPDIVTATFSAAAPAESIYVYEVSGVRTTGVATATGFGLGTSISTSSPVGFPSGAFLLGIIATNSSGGNVTAGTGFAPSEENSGIGVTHAQYSISNATSTTSFPATTNSAVGWVEVGIALMSI
jgi:hypothetical protein